LKRRSKGHQETTISGDTRADWSDAFALVPSLEVSYVWHASKFTREVLDGLRIGFLHHQQIIWDKGRAVLTRTHYWYGHEPVWYVRKKNAPWYGKPGENSTISELSDLREWLRSQGVTHVVMESTGSYWKPVFNVLEDAVRVYLANPQEVKNRKGHKTDDKDGWWLAHLLHHAMVQPSFIPPRAIRGLRDLTRRRKRPAGEFNQ
jgi:hypothetical protein